MGEIANEITIPDFVTHIGSYVFVKENEEGEELYENFYKDCITIIFGNGVRVIEDYAFRPGFTLELIGISNIEYIGVSAFKGCAFEQELLCFDSASFIAKEAFSHSYVGRIELPNVRNIGEFAFYDIDELTEVELSDNLKVLECGVFQDCLNLYSIVSRGINYIKDYAFYGCDSLSIVDLGDNIKSLGIECFQYSGDSSGFQNLNLESVEVVEGSCFSYSNIRNIVMYAPIPSNCIQNKSRAFLIECEHLESIKLCIEDCFAVARICENLEYAEIHIDCKNTNKISPLIYFCDNLRYLEIDVETLILADTEDDNLLVWGCDNLEKIVFSERVREIPAGIFRNLTNLKTIEFRGNTSILVGKIIYR